MKEYICKVCGYIHRDENPPEVCPICQALTGQFVELTEENKKKFEHLLIDTY